MYRPIRVLAEPNGGPRVGHVTIDGTLGRGTSVKLYLPRHRGEIAAQHEQGRQLADQARETRPGLKILFITGYAESVAIADGFLQPGMEMITKPFDLGDLSRRVRAMVSR